MLSPANDVGKKEKKTGKKWCFLRIGPSLVIIDVGNMALQTLKIVITIIIALYSISIQ